MAPKMFVALTLDHTLTKYNDALVQWHNLTYNTKYETSDLNALKDLLQDEVKIRAFENSNTFTLEMEGYDKDVRNALNDLRHYYDFVILTTRSRKIERYTREWIDHRYNGIFEKLHFAYEDEEENVTSTTEKKALSPKKSNASLLNDEKRIKNGKKIAELCQDFHIHLLIDKDLSGTLDIVKIPYKIHLKDDEGKIFSPLKNKNQPNSNNKNDGNEWLKICSTWAEIRKVLEETATELNLKNKSPGTKVSEQNDGTVETIAPPPAPKLSRYVDDLITITKKRSIAFFTKLILNKFRGQSELRLQGHEENIHAFIMVVNNVTQLRMVSNNAGSDDESSSNKIYKQMIPAKITSLKTSYMSLSSFYGKFRRTSRGEKSKSLPVLKVTLKRTKEYEQFLCSEKL